MYNKHYSKNQAQRARRHCRNSSPALTTATYTSIRNISIVSTSRGPRRGPPTATQGAAHQAPVAAWCCMSPRTKVTPATCPRSFRVSPLMLFTATHLQAAQDKHYEHRHGILCTPSTTRQEAGNTHRGAHLAFPHMQLPEEKTALPSPHFLVCLVCRLRSLLCEQRCPLSDYMGSWA